MLPRRWRRTKTKNQIGTKFLISYQLPQNLEDKFFAEKESLESFHVNFVELASQADCEHRTENLIRCMFTAHIHIEENLGGIDSRNTLTSGRVRLDKKEEKG